jgi:hypothetical protein
MKRIVKIGNPTDKTMLLFSSESRGEIVENSTFLD